MTKVKKASKASLGYVLDRIKEPSTLAGLGVLAALAGVDQAHVSLYTQALVGALGLAAVFVPEKK